MLLLPLLVVDVELLFLAIGLGLFGDLDVALFVGLKVGTVNCR